MSSSRRTTVAGLALGLLWSLSAAGAANPDGLSLITLDDTASSHQASTALLDQLKAALQPRFTDVRHLPGDALGQRVLHDLPRLPQRLADFAAAAPTRYALCLRSGAEGGEAALVDLTEGRLLAYRTLPAGDEAAVVAAIDAWVAQALPGADSARADDEPVTVAIETAAVTPVEATGEAALEVGGVTLAAATEPAPQASFAPHHGRVGPPRRRPQPPAQQPQPPAQQPQPPAQQPQPPAQQPEQDQPDPGWDAMLESYAHQALAAGTMGTPVDRPRVFETNCDLLLLPTGGGASARPVRAGITVFSMGNKARIETYFSRPVKTQVLGRRNGWYAADIEGYTVDAEQFIDVGRSGVLHLHVKPVDGGTRLGLQLTGAGAVDMKSVDEGRLLVATTYQDASLAAMSDVLNPEVLGDADFTVVRSFSGHTSWYGGRFHGRRTASGEVYNQWGWTAAHKTLPLGTWIRVTNPRNGRSAILKVNDRGPFVRGRSLDVTAACAQALGFYGAGVANLQIEVLKLR